MEEGKYKVFQVTGGWRVFYVEGANPVQPDVGREKPYAHKTHAYRRARSLNRKLQVVEEQIKRDGAIIV